MQGYNLAVNLDDSEYVVHVQTLRARGSPFHVYYVCNSVCEHILYVLYVHNMPRIVACVSNDSKASPFSSPKP